MPRRRKERKTRVKVSRPSGKKRGANERIVRVKKPIKGGLLFPKK